MRCLLLMALLAASSFSWAQKGVFLTADEFHAQAFADEPESKMLWLNNELLEQAQDILGHRYRGMRCRYKASGGRTAWIFEEIGKTHPITIGVVVDDSKIDQVRILEFRESRGGEVRYDNFTEQFIAVKLKPDKHKLNQNIDGITGATMSVRAVTKVATLALFFHSQIEPAVVEGIELTSAY